MDSAASLATTFFTDLPFSGEVNLLTTGAFGPGELFSARLLPRGVAYMAIGAPTAGRRLVGACGDEPGRPVVVDRRRRVPVPRRRDGAHVYRFGYSYSAQDYLGGNPAALAAAADGSRNVGELFALDRWAIAPAVAVEYGARYGRYDYLRPGGLFSPRVGRDGRTVQAHARLGHRGSAHGCARRRRIRRERGPRSLAAARTHVRASRRARTRPTRSASNARATSTC